VYQILARNVEKKYHLEELYTADSMILGFHIVNRCLRAHKGL